jgi:deazaflavin-dependent oxidoreductase (nitroreductase family)
VATTVPIMTTTFRRITERAGHRRAFAALARRLAPLDALIFKRSSGRLTILGPQGAGMPPTLLLTTTGRRTGKPRTTPVMYLTTESGLAITSESFGQARPAGWPQNLDADPRATAQIDDRARRYIARPATAEEVERLWPRFLAIWPAHQSYLDRSGVRRMFVLEPAGTRDVSPGFPGSARLGYPAAPAESLASLRAVALSGPV